MTTTVRVLKVGYRTQLDKVGSFIVKNVMDPENMTDEMVKTFCQALLTNKLIFAESPEVIESAEVITTVTDEKDVASVNSGGAGGGGD